MSMINNFKHKKRLEQTIALQHDQSDCGVACLLSIIQYYGGLSSLERLREISGTTRQGTTLLGLYQAANKLGFTAQGNEADIEHIINYKRPLILHVLLDDYLEHYIICYGYKNKKFIIGDPSKGIVEYTKEELNKIWKSKACLTLIPDNNFIEAKSVKKDKKLWFLRTLKEDKKLITFSLILGLGTASLGLAMVIFSQQLVDNIIPSKDNNRLIIGIFLVFFLLFIRVFLTALRDYFLIKQTKDFNNRIVDNFYSSLLNLPKPFFDTRKIGELVARLNDTQRIQKVIRQIVGNVSIDILVSFVSLSLLFYYSWQTGVITIISLPFYFFTIYSLNNRIVFEQKEVMKGYALSESNYIISMQGIDTIKNNNKQLIFQKMNKIIYGNYQDKIFILGKTNIKLSLLTGGFGVFLLTGILFYTSFQVINKGMKLGELVAVLGILGIILPSITNLALIAIPINEAKVAFNRMYEFAVLDKESKYGTPILKFETLTIKNLSFRFAGHSHLFENINLSINKNECIAIIGENGCGKSTLSQILQKFYDFEKGIISINNKFFLSEISTINWRDILGVVPQEITLFNGNVLDNILLGDNDTLENVMKFCESYSFTSFINDLPQGFDTILGEEGINLSGGQKQIIGLMRALYKKPQILLLDEFTSAMDRKTENFVLQLLNNLKKELAVVFISHRLHMLKYVADRIYIIENGETSLSGSHDELLLTRNFYSDYFE